MGGRTGFEVSFQNKSGFDSPNTSDFEKMKQNPFKFGNRLPHIHSSGNKMDTGLGLYKSKTINEPLINNSAYAVSPGLGRRGRKDSFITTSQKAEYVEEGCVCWKVVVSVIAFLAFLLWLDYLIRSGVKRQAE